MSYIKKFMAFGKEYFDERCDRDIEHYRKGDFKISVTKNGKPQDAKVSYKLKKHDFEFGCNLFMLEQYEDTEAQKTYEELWLKVFNTGVVPLYWEGTEPTRGYLRYDRKVPNDIYRRPPAERVVEWCEENGVKPKGHPLFWQEFIPNWLPDDWNELLPLIEKRFQEISAIFKTRVPVFDVVNEPSRLFDQRYEIVAADFKRIQPPFGYIEQVFKLAQKYFLNNEFILNEAVGAALCEFRGPYGAYYQMLDRLINQGVKIDRIGLQCHCYDSGTFKNIYDAKRLYGVLDGYAELNRPLVMSEIGLSCEDQQIQAEATEQLYKVCFSHPAMSGIFWWNLDDNGVLSAKSRDALGENLPNSGLVRNGAPKEAYKVIDRLINHEWHTEGEARLQNGEADFRGFYGTYDITVTVGDVVTTVTAEFLKDGENCVEIMI